MRGIFSRETSPIWMDSTTAEECREITAAVGGEMQLARRTGSRAFERFTGPQIRRFFTRAPAAYESTDRIHLVSSFLASLLAGRHAPVEPGDASGMNLMDLAAREWWRPAVNATAPDLARKLPPIVEPWSSVGALAPYWQHRHGFAAVPVIAWTGDNPSSLVGVGLVEEGRIAVSLGTSDTVFGPMSEPRVDDSGDRPRVWRAERRLHGAHLFSERIARARARTRGHGLTWPGFSRALASTPPGNGGRLMLPWFAPEITPPVNAPGVRRYGPDDGGYTDVRAVVEGQQMAMALHSRWMARKIDAIHATGGAATNARSWRSWLTCSAPGCFSCRLATPLRSVRRYARPMHTCANAIPTTWDDVIRGLAEPSPASRVDPDPRRHAIYREMMPLYAACEAHALGRGPAPRP